ncbi:MAG TPA: tetratricopeptide repeat protein [Spirochaetales bacterium]|nr:tetratricopeptide repeat protein [Spirochaetales bacterium]MBP7264180.1 tetratricopeptide repeat protein [Spirochaetia bacterium]HPE36251.1 tetratricopeptide repeat protein [Spirochaetales bacterium]
MPARRNAAIVLCLVLAAQAWAQAKPDALKLYREGKYDQARAVCLAEIEQAPGNMESYVVLGWSLLALGRYADAELYGTRAYESIRRDPRIVEILGEAAYHQGKNDQALERFEQYVNLLPDGERLGTVYFFMGEIYLRQELWSHADIAFRTAVQYEPGKAAWWTRLGYAREKNRDWTWALEAYEKALELDPAAKDARLGRDRVRAELRA